MNSNLCSASSDVTGPCVPRICMLHNGVALKKRLYLKASNRPYRICIRKRNCSLHVSCQILQKWPDEFGCSWWGHLWRFDLKVKVTWWKSGSPPKERLISFGELIRNAVQSWLGCQLEERSALCIKTTQTEETRGIGYEFQMESYWWLSQVLNHRYQRIIKLLLVCYSSDE